MKPDANVVVILGMDRTGTSLCTNILGALGMRLSPRLLPATNSNPRGYFEDEDILLVHERILGELARSWDALAAIHPFPTLWWQSAKMSPLRDALVDIVRGRTAEGPDVWGFKDPRTVALLPIWNGVFQICSVRPIYVLCVRHPAAVARSLTARDGLSVLLSELLWFEKTLAGCIAIQDNPHCLIHYEEWFDDPMPQTNMLCRIAGLAPADGPAALKARVSSIIDSSLRHHGDGVILSPAARDLYAHLVHSAKVPDRGILNHFEFACEVVQDFIAGAEYSMIERHLGRSAVSGEQAALAPDRFRLILCCQEAERRLRETEEDRARWIERCSSAEHALVERDARLREIEEDRARWIERCSSAEHALVERDARLREIEEDRARWIERCSSAEHALVERNARLRDVEEGREGAAFSNG
jgi:hypothetical protein